MCLVLGTSLTVGPANSVPELVGRDTPRVLVNMERAGSFGSRANDVLLLGSCDDVCVQLAKSLGWLERLVALRDQMAPASREVVDAATKE